MSRLEFQNTLYLRTLSPQLQERALLNILEKETL